MITNTSFWRSIVCPLIVLISLIGTVPGQIPIEESLSLNAAAEIAIELSFDSEVGKYYQVEISNDLVNWGEEGYSIEGTGGRISTLVSGRSLNTAMFRIHANGDPANTMPVGAPGKSAYEIWLDEGNVGSENEFFKAFTSPELPLVESSEAVDLALAGDGGDIIEGPTSATASGPIEFVDATSVSSAVTVGSFSLAAPAGVQEDDLLLMSMFHGASPDPVITAPRGWTQLYQQSTSGGKHTVYYRVAGASEPGSYDWRLSRDKHIAAGMAAYRGVDTAALFHAQVTGHEFSVPGISLELTTTTAGTQLVMFTAFRAASAGATPGPNLTERVEAAGGLRSLEMADELLGPAGTNTRSMAVDDAGGAVEIFGFLVALEPMAAVNLPPTVDSVAEQLNYEGDGVDLQIVANDPEGDLLTYSASGLPSGLAIGSVDGRVTGTIGAGAFAGSPYAVTVSVSDGLNPAVDAVFSWTIIDGVPVPVVVPEEVFSTLALTEESRLVTAPETVTTQGFGVAGDGGGTRFKQVPAEPSHEGKLALTLGDGTTVWYEIADEKLRPEMFGAFPDGVSDAAAAAAKAMGVIEARGGGILSFEGVGTYRLESQGIHPGATGHQVAIHIPCDDVEIIIAQHSTLKLADDQQANASSPVEIISWGVGRSNIFIHGGGTILGNTAGQANWTGGFQQNDGGNIISSFGGGDRHIRIEDLHLRDFFSSPINLGGNIRSSDIRLRGLRCRNTGEGAQIVSADGVTVEDHWQEDDLDIQGARGDALELADCSDFLVSAVRIKATGGTVGAAIDLYSSTDGVVDGFVIDGWNLAFDMGTSGSRGPVDRVRVSDGVIRNIKSPWIFGLAQGRLTYSDIAVFDCPSSFLFQLSPVDTNDFPPVVLNNVKAENVAGALILGGRELVWHGGGIRDSTYGISFNYGLPGDRVRRVDLKDLAFSGITNPAIRVAPGSEPVISVVGRMTGIRLEGASDFSASSVGDFSGCEMSGFSPRGLVADGPVRIAPFELLTRSATNLTTLNTPSLNQRLVIRATGAFSVIDASSPGGLDIHLSGGNDFAMGSGDRLVLDYDGTGWYEVSRSEN